MNSSLFDRTYIIFKYGNVKHSKTFDCSVCSSIYIVIYLNNTYNDTIQLLATLNNRNAD